MYIKANRSIGFGLLLMIITSMERRNKLLMPSTRHSANIFSQSILSLLRFQNNWIYKCIFYLFSNLKLDYLQIIYFTWVACVWWYASVLRSTVRCLPSSMNWYTIWFVRCSFRCVPITCICPSICALTTGNNRYIGSLAPDLQCSDSHVICDRSIYHIWYMGSGFRYFAPGMYYFAVFPSL